MGRSRVRSRVRLRVRSRGRGRVINRARGRVRHRSRSRLRTRLGLGEVYLICVMISFDEHFDQLSATTADTHVTVPNIPYTVVVCLC